MQQFANEGCPFPPDHLPEGEGRFHITSLSPLWDEDELDVTDKCVEVWEWDDEHKNWPPLHLTISTNDGSIVSHPTLRWTRTTVPVNMGQVRERCMRLVSEGGPLWPGIIDPLSAGGHYLITITEDRHGQDPWTFLAIISARKETKP